jgi:2-phosphosulfolactate phosphatase
MTPRRTVKIDAFPTSAFRYLEHDAIACIDVIRATTTVATSLARGRRTYVAASPDEAREMAARLSHPLLSGEVGGLMPEGFEIQNSPAAVQVRGDMERPLVLVSSSGTQLLVNACGGNAVVYAACLRNMEATVDELAESHDRVALLGAGSRNEFRCEDQMAAGKIAARLIERGYVAEDMGTEQMAARWAEAEVSLIAWGKSAEYLRRSHQHKDLEFVLAHVDDLGFACRFDGLEAHAHRTEITPAPAFALPFERGPAAAARFAGE